MPEDVKTSDDSPGPIWVQLLASLIALVVLFMIIVGAMVVNIEAGDSDLSWSFKFWEWFARWTDAQAGLQYELFHCMVGTVIGFLSVALLGLLFVVEKRRWVKLFGVGLLLLVIAQGLMGALRVKLVSDPRVQDIVLEATGGGYDIEPSRQAFTIVHGILAQLTFVWAVLLATVTTLGWMRPAQIFKSAVAKKMQRLACMTTAFLVVQLVLGAMARHTHSSLMIYVHMAWAVVVVMHIAMLSKRANHNHFEAYLIRQPAALMVFMTAFQVVLGLAAWLMTRESTVAPPASLVSLVRSGHVATGATILALSAVVMMRSFRLLEQSAEENV